MFYRGKILKVSAMNRLVIPLLLLLALPAGAQTLPAGGNGGPVTINADTLEMDQNQKIYIARGNAEVKQGGVTITARVLTARYVENGDGSTTFTEVNAEGNIHITSGKGEVFGERGIYNVAREVAVLKGGNLRLTTPTDTVTARDSLEFWQKENLAVARGQAVAIRGDNRISGDILTALLSQSSTQKAEASEVKRVAAEGNVIITTPSEIVRGNKGRYDVARQRAVLDGAVRITRGPNQLKGNRAEVNMATGISRLLSGPGQRVQALVVPQNAPKVR